MDYITLPQSGRGYIILFRESRCRSGKQVSTVTSIGKYVKLDELVQ